MIDVHEDFLMRHTTIKTSINDTYRIGNQLLDYVEKQMIIDYHLRGEQRRLEQEFPAIAKKAKKFLGYEMYFELSINQIPNVPMSPQHRNYEFLMNKQKLIVDRIMKEYEKHQEKTGDRFTEKLNNDDDETDVDSAYMKAESR